MKVYPFAIASAAVIGTAAVLVASGTAAQPSTRSQLLINQRISQAAVRRSNSALNYLAPIRTTQSDAANTGKNGVTPLSKVAGAGKGWPTTAIADEAITSAKLAAPVQAVVNNVTRVAPTRLTSGQTATIWTSGALTLQATCAISSGGSDIASVTLTSTQAGAAADGTFAANTNANPPVATETPTQAPSIAANTATTILRNTIPTGAVSGSLNSLDASGIGPDGTRFTADLTLGTNLGIGATNGGASTCTVFGSVIS